MSDVRILLTGSRGWSDADLLYRVLVDTVNEHREAGDSVTLVVGDCPTGADARATELWRHWHAIHPNWFNPAEVHEAYWKSEGKAAGPNRNQRMVDAGGDVALAFPLDGARGTWDCVRRAQKAGIPVRVVPEGEENAG